MLRPSRLLASLAVASFAGCAGPPVPAPIEGLPVCADFSSGKAKMEGGLRYPVRLRILDGKTVLFKMVLGGLRHADDPKPRTLLADDNAKYTVEWAQCSNERAPVSATEATKSTKARDHEHKEQVREHEGTSYDCGDPKVYKADGVLEIRKGDRASHVVTFVAPPDTTCWAGDPPAAKLEVPVEDAGTGVAGAITDSDAGAAADAGAAIPASTSADAGAAPKGDAGAK
jgi:hypothetical protein